MKPCTTTRSRHTLVGVSQVDSDASNAPIKIQASNGLGYGGGNAANTLRVAVVYMILNIQQVCMNRRRAC